MVTNFGVVVLVCLKFCLTSSGIVFNYDDDLEVGSTCRFHGNNSEGICREVRNCPGAYRDHQERNISPTICAFDANQFPIVCCGYKRRYEAACAAYYGEPDTSQVCPMLGHKGYICENDSGSKYLEYPVPQALGGVRAGIVWHMATLGWRYNGTTLYKCGGTLISAQFALTAAHCTLFYGVPPNIVRTSAEHLLEEDPDNTFQILEIITHPGYRPTIHYHDIALIRFDRKYLDDFACLPPEHLIYDEDIIYDASRWGQVEALGYGSTSFGGPTDDLHLVKVNIDLLPDKNCTEPFPPDANQPKGYQKSTQICAGDINKGIRDTCQGDSGGPLQRLFKETIASSKIHYVFGIISYGRSCGSGQPAIYTRVTSYLDWIESIVWPTEIGDNSINLTQNFGCDEEQKLCLKKIRSFYKTFWP